MKTNSKYNYKTGITSILCAFFSSAAVCVDINLPKGSPANIFSAYVLSLKSIWAFFAVWIVLAGVYYLICSKIEKEKIYLRVTASAVLSVLQVGGLSLYYTASLRLLHSNTAQLFKTVVMLIGYFFIYYYGVRFIYFIINREQSNKLSGLNEFIFEKHPFGCAFLLSIILRAFSVIAKFPARIDSDTCWELYMFFRGDVSAHHTVYHTFLIKAFSELGILLGNQAWGFFLLVFFEFIASATIIAYSLTVAKKLRFPIWPRYLLLFVLIAIPYSLAYTASVEKDVMFTWGFYLLIVQIVLACNNIHAFFDEKRNVAITFIAIMLVLFYRHNGIYIVVAASVILAVYVLIKYRKRIPKKFSKRTTKIINSLMVIVIIPIVLLNTFNYSFMIAFNLARANPKEALSFPFMQTARYIAYYDDEVTDYEREVLNKTFHHEDTEDDLYEYMRQSYLKSTDINAIAYKDNTVISDIYKDAFSVDLSVLPEYFKVWFQMFLKKPLVYIEATWACEYSLGAYDDFRFNMNYNPESFPFWDDLIFFDVPQYEKALDGADYKLYSALSKTPVINVLNDYTTYSVLFFILIIVYINDVIKKNEKRRRLGIPLLFVLLALGMVILGPCVIPRYMLPIMYSVPFILGAYSSKAFNKNRGRVV